MEQTMGKRIAACRKGLGLTQDQLAEQLGVTAQAVSKWENDQSCPDIAMLPRLAEVFGTTTDALLGVERKVLCEAEVVTEPEAVGQEPQGQDPQRVSWELKLGYSFRGRLGMAMWVLLVGGLLLASNVLNWNVGFWEILWPTGLLVFGLFGILPRPSIFRMGCLLFGLYFLLDNINLLPLAVGPIVLGREVLLPAFLLLFGLSLLVDALRRPKADRFGVFHTGRERTSSFTTDDTSFCASNSFGEDRRTVAVSSLRSGTAETSFGALKVDITGCGAIAEDCCLVLNSSFGDLTLLVPKWCRAEIRSKTAFGNVEVKGEPDPDFRACLTAQCNASFGNISVEYV